MHPDWKKVNSIANLVTLITTNASCLAPNEKAAFASDVSDAIARAIELHHATLPPAKALADAASRVTPGFDKLPAYMQQSALDTAAAWYRAFFPNAEPSKGNADGVRPATKEEEDAVDAAVGLEKVTFRLFKTDMDVIRSRARQDGMPPEAYIRRVVVSSL